MGIVGGYGNQEQETMNKLILLNVTNFNAETVNNMPFSC